MSEITFQHDAQCPTCHGGWWLNPPVKCSGSDAYRCINCKAIYTGVMLRAASPASAGVGEEEGEEELRKAQKKIKQLELVLLHISTMDVYTRLGEEPADELMRRLAKEAISPARAGSKLEGK